MGYEMEMENSKFMIKEENIKKAEKALKTQFQLKERHLEDMLEELNGWSCEFDEEGNLTNIEFEGVKLHDDEEMFRTIAPFVEDGSYIEMSGEGGDLWRWIFKDKKLINKKAKNVWD
jgi:hypothetical protein